MSPQPMPVANALTQPGRRVLYPTCDPDDPERWLYHTRSGESWAESQVFAETMLSKCTRVWLGRPPAADDIIARPGATDEEFQGQLRSTLGPQLLPFDWMWFEGHWPWGLRSGVEAIAVRATNRGTQGDGVVLHVFELLSGGDVRRWPAAVVLEIDSHGTILHLSASGQTVPNEPFVFDMGQKQRLLMIGMAMPALWGVGLMNCRNVHTVEVTPEPRKTKKQRRPRKAGVSYHTIVLPSLRHAGKVLDPSLGSLADQPLHLVRGHFKTYTEDAPLLGKHVGTYWWGHQVRGSKENGEIVSDYVVAR